MTWADRVRAEMPKQDIPTFLGDVQALVAALREGREWEHLLSPTIHRHRELALAYLDDGPTKDRVAKELADAPGRH